MAGTIRRVFQKDIVAAPDTFSQAYRAGVNESPYFLIRDSQHGQSAAGSFLGVVTNLTGGTWSLSSIYLWEEDSGGSPLDSGVASLGVSIAANGIYRLPLGTTFNADGDAVPIRAGRWAITKSGVGNHNASFEVYQISGAPGGAARVLDSQTAFPTTGTVPIIGGGGHAAAKFFVRTRAITGTWDVTLRLAIGSNTIDIASLTGITAVNSLLEIPRAADFASAIPNAAIPEPNVIFYNEAVAGTWAGDVIALYGD